MSMGSLSERDRLRMAELLRAPLFPPPNTPSEPPRPHMKWTWVDRAVRIVKAHLAVHWREWAVGAGAMALCLAAVSLTVGVKAHHVEDSIQLQAMDQKGQLEIRWDPDADAIRRALDAKLFIMDGDDRIFVKLSPSRLRQGVVSYGRQSDRVYLRMAVSEPDGKLVEEHASFVGAGPVSPPEPQLEARAKPAKPTPIVSGPQPEALPKPAKPTPFGPEPQLEALAKPAKPTPFGSAPTVAGVAPAAGASVASAPVADRVSPIEHRARKSSMVASGKQLPFTCSTGDVFRKTDAPPGW